MLTNDQIGGIIRAIVTTITGILVGKGVIDNNTALWIVGGAGSIGVAAWSWWTNRPQKIVNSATGQPKAS
jgi:hypothetical protein